MKKKIALLALLSGILYIIWEWWDKMESPCGCGCGCSGSTKVATGSSSLVLPVLAAKVDELEKKTINQFLSGVGIPSDSLGENGDTYLDLSTGNIYSKNNKTWL